MRRMLVVWIVNFLFLFAGAAFAQANPEAPTAPEVFGFAPGMAPAAAEEEAQRQSMECQTVDPGYVWCEKNLYRVLQYFNPAQAADGLAMIRYLLYYGDDFDYAHHLQIWRSELGIPLLQNDADRWALWRYPDGAEIAFREEVRHGTVRMTIADYCAPGEGCADEVILAELLAGAGETLCLEGSEQKPCSAERARELYRGGPAQDAGEQ